MKKQRWIVMAELFVCLSPMIVCGIFVDLFRDELEQWTAAGQLNDFAFAITCILAYLYWRHHKRMKIQVARQESLQQLHDHFAMAEQREKINNSN